MKKRNLAIVLSIIMILTLFAGCGKSDYATSDSDYKGSSSSYNAPSASDVAWEPGEAYDEGYFVDVEDDYSASNIEMLEVETEPGRLVILNAGVSIETTDFAGSVYALREKVKQFGGYISGSSTSIYNSYYSLHDGNYTIRIPSENFNSFIAEQDAIGSVSYCNVWSDDVTASYRDIETRLTTLRTKYDRLLAMLEKAELMSDIIEIEDALSRTTYEIESYENSLRSYDDRISYSTISLSIREVREVTEPVVLPKTLGERISARFKRAMENTAEFFEDFIVGFVGALPGLIIIGVIAAVVIAVIVKTRAKRLVRREKRREKNEEIVRQFKEKRDASIIAAGDGKKTENTEK